MIIYAMLLILLPRLRPQGILGRRELWHFWTKRKDKPENDEGGSGPAVR
jgi:hypothetical protein